MTPPLVHLGLHRTGSTWFQTRVLDGRDGRPVNACADRAESTRRLVLARDLDYDPSSTRDWAAEAFARAAREGHAPVMSNERFSGNPAAGWNDAERTARRIADAIPDAKVLLVVREQVDLLRSIWLQQIRIGGICGIEDFLRPPEPGDHRLPVPDPSFLMFDRYVDLLDEAFGRDRVLVLPFEMLRSDTGAFLARVAAFSGIPMPPPADAGPVYAAPSLLWSAVMRRVNLLSCRTSLHRAPPFPSLHGPGKRLAGLADRLATARGERRRRARATSAIRQRLASLPLVDSNRRLGERLSLDLADFGWCT